MENIFRKHSSTPPFFRKMFSIIHKSFRKNIFHKAFHPPTTHYGFRFSEPISAKRYTNFAPPISSQYVTYLPLIVGETFLVAPTTTLVGERPHHSAVTHYSTLPLNILTRVFLVLSISDEVQEGNVGVQ